MSDTEGQARVKRLEMNNRNTSTAKGPGMTTPKKKGAQSGFASNPTKGGGIFRPLKGRM